MELGLGPLPVLQTFGQRAVLLAGGILEGTGDYPLGRASAAEMNTSSGRASLIRKNLVGALKLF